MVCRLTPFELIIHNDIEHLKVQPAIVPTSRKSANIIFCIFGQCMLTTCQNILSSDRNMTIRMFRCVYVVLKHNYQHLEWHEHEIANVPPIAFVHDNG